MSGLTKALEKYYKAQRELSEYVEPARCEVDEQWLTLSCPVCGTCFWRGLPHIRPHFEFPVICCGKIRIMP